MPAKPLDLHLEPDELKQLIELAYLGEWLVNAHHSTDHQDDSADKRLQQLLKLAKLPEIGKDAETGEYFIESEWANRLYDQYILDYDDHVFWDELTERLAQRDLARIRGIAIEEIDRDEDLAKLRPLEQTYREEFERNGVDHLELGEHF